jgi:dTDP-4-dehydrorhamnose reductase
LTFNGYCQILLNHLHPYLFDMDRHGSEPIGKERPARMKILITGGKGQLGVDCGHVFATKHEVLSIDIEEADITDPGAVEVVVKAFRPDCIINCAAFTRVDDCETERSLAWAVNVKGPENLAKCVSRYGGRLVHISTDYVFDGRRKVPSAYTEGDGPCPISYYGNTKFEGERAVIQGAKQHVVVRTAWMYGKNGPNFLKTMLRLALSRQGHPVRVVNDQYGSPTWSMSLAHQISRLIETEGQGIYHASAEGYCTWFELASYFLEKMDLAGRVVPCTTRDYPTTAARPMNSILENGNLNAAGINIMASWQEDLDHFVDCHGEDLFREVSDG